MAQESTKDHVAFTQIVESTLQKAQGNIAGLRKTNMWLLIISIVTSAATTLIAGGTAAAGPMVGEGIEGWRIACIGAAIFAFASTVSTALSQQMKIGEQLVQGAQYIGRLRAIQVAIATGSQPWEEITKEFGEVARTYPEFGG